MQLGIYPYFRAISSEQDCEVIINGGKTTLAKNVTVVLTPDGVVSGVECEGTAITLNDAVQQLIDQGILVKM